jgi:hypothetical protein
MVLNQAIDWAQKTCPWKAHELHQIGGRLCLVTDVFARLDRIGEGFSLIWVARAMQPDGSSFTVSERSMPTRDDPQN